MCVLRKECVCVFSITGMGVSSLKDVCTGCSVPQYPNVGCPPPLNLLDRFANNFISSSSIHTHKPVNHAFYKDIVNVG